MTDKPEIKFIRKLHGDHIADKFIELDMAAVQFVADLDDLKSALTDAEPEHTCSNCDVSSVRCQNSDCFTFDSLIVSPCTANSCIGWRHRQ